VQPRALLIILVSICVLNGRAFLCSIGHVMNDSTAACWFSYLLIYLEKVRTCPAGPGRMHTLP
jgi:hypothetical protein